MLSRSFSYDGKLITAIGAKREIARRVTVSFEIYVDSQATTGVVREGEASVFLLIYGLQEYSILFIKQIQRTLDCKKNNNNYDRNKCGGEF